MRIPHTIDQSTLLAYGLTKDARTITSERGRILRPEDPNWDAGLVPRLADLCTLALPAILAPALPCTARMLMLDTLPTNLPLPLATKIIQDGMYWKRRTQERWQLPHDIQDSAGSWKRYFMEKHTQEFVENLSPDGYVKEELEDLCDLVSDHVYCLNLRQLLVQRHLLDLNPDLRGEEEPQDRIDLSPLVSRLRNLVELHIQYSVRDLGSNYRKVLLLFTTRDCRNLGHGVANATALRLLRIHHSALDDEKLAALLSPIKTNTSLEALAFPHCRLGDEGAATLAKFISDKPKFQKLDISNNFVGKAGVQALSFVLTQQNGYGLKELNLCLNNFGDAGAQYLFSALQRKAPAMCSLNISCAGLAEDSGLLLGEVLARNSCLTHLDVSNNSLGAAAGPGILKALQVNTSLQFLDLRMTGVETCVQQQIEDLLHANCCREYYQPDTDDFYYQKKK